MAERGYRGGGRPAGRSGGGGAASGEGADRSGSEDGGRRRDPGRPHASGRPDLPRPAPGQGARPRPARTPDTVLLWGTHAVTEALRSPRRKPVRLLATAGAAERLAEALAARQMAPTVLLPADLDALVPRDAVHQGVVLEARALENGDISDLPAEGTVVVLDQITDPHNVGAILRSAAAFGAVALVTTERHAPEMTGVLAKAASGGLEHVPVIAVTNLARALDAMARNGYQLIGLDSEGDVDLAAVRPAPAVALLMGAEGRGLRRLTRDKCEVVARLDMPGPIKSLNVSNACAVALAVLRRRGGAQ